MPQSHVGSIAGSIQPTEDEQHDRAVARLGTKLGGRWTLKRILGMGGAAAVFEAEHDNGLRVAIKVLHPELTQVPEAKERFLDEAYVANHVGHTGTVQVLDDGVADDGSPFLVMDFFDGETLDSRWERSARILPVLDVFCFMQQLLDVVRASHENGIVHRDIKPDNIFLTVEGEIKLLDFGIARMAESHRSLRTQVGATMGTPTYMAPEQARGRWEDVDEQSDIWSLGATMFALTCGRTVHEAETNNELLLASMTEPASRLRTFATDVPEMAASVIDKALAFEKVDRYASAEEMLSEVRYVVQGLEQERRERSFSSTPPVAETPLEALRSSMPPTPSTFRPVARNRRSEPTQLNMRPPRRRHQGLFATIVIAMSALGGYLAVSSLARNENASVVAQQESRESEVFSSRAAPEAPSARLAIPEQQTRLGETFLDSTSESTAPAPIGGVEETTEGEKVTPPDRLASSDRTGRPVRPAVRKRLAAPTKTTTRQDPGPDASSDQNNDENYDPLRMRR